MNLRVTKGTLRYIVWRIIMYKFKRFKKPHITVIHNGATKKEPKEIEKVEEVIEEVVEPIVEEVIVEEPKEEEIILEEPTVVEEVVEEVPVEDVPVEEVTETPKKRGRKKKANVEGE